MGKWCRISSTSYTSLPPGPAPPAHGRADLGFSERHVDIVALYLHVVLGDGLDSREGERFPCGHVELRAVARALYLRADQLSLIQRPSVVGADVLDGVELAFHVAEGDPMALHLVDAHLAWSNIPGLGYLVELGHLCYPFFEAEPDLGLYRPVQLLLEARQRNAARDLAEEAEDHELLGLRPGDTAAHQVEEIRGVHLPRRRAVGAFYVVGHDLQVRQTDRHRVIGAKYEVPVGLVGVS